ncbi:MAG: FAD-binding and (Fe-S)-binding domain-containing protein [Phycisphaerae bacterium]
MAHFVDLSVGAKGGTAGVRYPIDVNARAIEEALRQSIQGEVRFDNASRALYATDGSNYRQVPIGVVIPKTIDDVVQTVALCRKHAAPIFSRGGGTSLAGQCCNVAVVMDFSKYMHHVLRIDPDRKLGTVQPGCVCDDLRNAAEKYNLTFGPDPATHRWCTLGGMIGNNSCGTHSQMAGRTSDNVHELEILTYDGTRMRVGQTGDAELERIIRAGGRRGEIYTKLRAFRDRYADLIRQRFPDIPRRISGYNLPALLPENGFHVARALVGSESTLVTVLEATLNLVHSPPVRTLVVLGYPDVFAAADHIMEVTEFGPIGLEGLDHKFVADLEKKHLQQGNIDLFPPGGGFLLVEFGGDTREESNANARRMMDALQHKRDTPSMKLFDDKAEEQRIWRVRESGLGATAHVPGRKENWEGWEDSAVEPAQLGQYLREFKKLLDKYHYTGALYGHFGQGCLHTRIDFDLKTAQGVRIFRSFIEEAADLVVKHHGSFSGEHGDGQSRAELLPKMYGHDMVRAFDEFKNIWDPDWKMNPGKVVKPYRLDENLRYGPTYNPPEPRTHFKYADDSFSFRQATERCVGVGECRREHAGTMCPSYRVTREEKHTTRGRAHLLFEMLRGEVIREGWQSEAVKDSLDLCLSCKGCKGDCPVHVDLATYKAEFLSHYYKGRLRPRHAYAFGLIHVWARMAGHFPRLANFFTHARGLRRISKWLAGMAPQRTVPAFARETFKHWWMRREPRNQDKPTVLLFADTFNNHFHPDVAQAAVEVLEAAGWRVAVPMQDLCCGRPLYDYGMLDRAEKWLRQILETLRPYIQAGTPMVVLEPSCCAVFRDEMVNLFPHDLDAQRLRSQTFLLSEFFQRKASDFRLPKLHRMALVHAHCHHRAIMGPADEQALLDRLGLDYKLLDSGCCGMAGAFGFEAGDHYDVSVKCGELVLLPAVRQAPYDQLIITNGFSCHEQIAQGTDRQALHLAQVLRMALHEGVIEPEPRAPEIPAAQEADRQQREPPQVMPHDQAAPARVDPDDRRSSVSASEAAVWVGGSLLAGLMVYMIARNAWRTKELS